MRSSKRKFAGFLLAALVATFCSATSLLASNAIGQLILVQNSGWMLPFYDDPKSKMKDLVAELCDRVMKYGDSRVTIASFNQSFSGNESPKLCYQGGDRNQIRAAVRAIEPAMKPGRSSYADTDFKEAIIGAITKYSPGKPCILWIVTNNKNSPGNSPETVEKNKEFYGFLQESQDIRRIIAFPYALKVQSQTRPEFTANGLMIYGIAYGEAADQRLQQMLAANAPFGKQTARLKPLDAEALTFVPGGVRGSESLKAYLPDKKTLVLSYNATSKPEAAEISGKFRNDFFPYDIKSASIRMESGFKGGKGPITSQMSTNAIANIPAGGQSSDVVVRLAMPPIPSPWSPEVIFGSGYRAYGIIQFELVDQQLEISQDFVKSMNELFPNDPLPELFVPGTQARRSITQQPLIIDVVYPVWPIVLFGLVCLALVATLVGGAVYIRREQIYRLSVDGIQKSVALRPFGKAVVMNAQGVRVGELHRGLGAPTFTPEKGSTSTVRIV